MVVLCAVLSEFFTQPQNTTDCWSRFVFKWQPDIWNREKKEKKNSSLLRLLDLQTPSDCQITSSGALNPHAAPLISLLRSRTPTWARDESKTWSAHHYWCRDRHMENHAASQPPSQTGTHVDTAPLDTMATSKVWRGLIFFVHCDSTSAMVRISNVVPF